MLAAKAPAMTNRDMLNELLDAEGDELQAAVAALLAADTFDELSTTTRAMWTKLGVPDHNENGVSTRRSPLGREHAKAQTAKRAMEEASTDEAYAAAQKRLATAELNRREKTPALRQQIADLEAQLAELATTEDEASWQVSAMQQARDRLADLAPTPIVDETNRAIALYKKTDVPQRIHALEERLRYIDSVQSIEHTSDTAIRIAGEEGLQILTEQNGPRLRHRYVDEEEWGGFKLNLLVSERPQVEAELAELRPIMAAELAELNVASRFYLDMLK